MTPHNPNPSGNWRFDIALSIPSSENEDSHEDRGPNQLDPCDSVTVVADSPRRGGQRGAGDIMGGGGGAGWGGSSPGPETIYGLSGTTKNRSESFN